MALKAQLEQWQAAIESYDRGDYSSSLDLLRGIAVTAKIHFDIGMLLHELKQYEEAISCYTEALFLDKYFAVAYFQRGISQVSLRNMEAAYDDFNDALLHLRGNLFIDYTQIGMDFKLFSCEILFNRGIVSLFLGDRAQGYKDIQIAEHEKQIESHNRINRVLNDKDAWKSAKLFELEKGKLFRPNSDKVKNVQKKDYLGKSALISAVDDGDLHTGFKGAATRKAQIEALKTPTTAGQPTLSRSISAAQNYAPPNHPIRRMASDAGFGRPKGPKIPGVKDMSSTSPSSLSPVDALRNHGHSQQQKNLPLIPPLNIGGSFSNEVKANSDFWQSSSPTSTAPGGGNVGVQQRGLARLSRAIPNGSSPLRMQPIVQLPLARNDSMSGGGGGGNIKLKCHYEDTRVFMVDENITYGELYAKIRDKLKIERTILIKYLDEEGELVVLNDDDDLEAAKVMGRECGNARVPKMELWCYDK